MKPRYTQHKYRANIDIAKSILSAHILIESLFIIQTLLQDHY